MGTRVRGALLDGADSKAYTEELYYRRTYAGRTIIIGEPTLAANTSHL
jgi:hypothetical protein